MRVVAGIVAVAGLICVLAAGCWRAPRCVPGASVPCACTDGQSGAQACAADGTFGACACLPILAPAAPIAEPDKPAPVFPVVAAPPPPTPAPRAAARPLPLAQVHGGRVEQPASPAEMSAQQADECPMAGARRACSCGEASGWQLCVGHANGATWGLCVTLTNRCLYRGEAATQTATAARPSPTREPPPRRYSRCLSDAACDGGRCVPVSEGRAERVCAPECTRDEDCPRWPAATSQASVHCESGRGLCFIICAPEGASCGGGRVCHLPVPGNFNYCM